MRFAIWCRCGQSIDGTVIPGRYADSLLQAFRDVHAEAGCELTSDPVLGRRWRRRIRDAERRERYSD